MINKIGLKLWYISKSFLNPSNTFSCFHDFTIILGVLPEEKESPKLDIEIAIGPAEDESTTSSESESSTDKKIADHLPDDQKSPGIDIADVPADEESSTSSDSSSDDEMESQKSSTVETITVEKSHSQVSTSITEITTNTHNYPAYDLNFPAISPNYSLGSSDVPEDTPIFAEIPTIDSVPKPVEEVQPMEDIPKSEYSPTFAEYPTPKDFTTTVDGETTQTDDNADKDLGTTRDAYSMTPAR